MSLFDLQLTGRFRSSQLIIVALNAAIMKLGQCAYEFPHDLSLYMEFISVLNSSSGVMFAFATKRKSLAHVPLSV